MFIMSSLCAACKGSGKKMGLGMIYQDCDVCDGDGKVKNRTIVVKSKGDNSLDRRSADYQNAIKNIMSSSDCDRQTAIKTFDEEFTKL